MAEQFRLPRVKVCGLASAADAMHALAAGAEALGFVFHPGSPRCIEREVVTAICELLPAEVLTVAVVVDTSLDQADQLLGTTGLRAIQLCGAQHPQDWSDFHAPILRRIGVEVGAQAELAEWREVAAGFVLDNPSSPGGTGREVDRDLAAELCRAHPCLLAGGLDAERVAPAIRDVRPAGVDASSRLEQQPGQKDPAAVEAFVRIALDTLAGLQA